MTSQGSEAGQQVRAFDNALRDQNLRMALACARDLPSLSLNRAAKLLWLMSRQQSPLFDKAARRWLTRYVNEIPDLTPGKIADVADALAGLPAVDAAETLLAATASRR